jgi:decaprenylphospho-beta-D-erythro-pentofuranosid-2-ulose 2-reductase
MSGTWIILGANSALAKAFSRHAATQGARLLLAGRKVDELNTQTEDLRLRGASDIRTLKFDARDDQDRKALLATLPELTAPISIYWAIGSMPEEADMRADAALCRSMLDNNYSSAVLTLSALLPQLETQKAGAVIILGSVAGDRGRKKNFIYGSSKAGLAAYAQGLAAHLSAFRVPVLLVKPGVMDTPMTWGKKNPPLPLGAPEGLAKACWRRAKNGGTLYYPWFWQIIMLAIMHLPRKIFNKLNF